MTGPDPATRVAKTAAQVEHVEQLGPESPAPLWLPRDGSGGVPHLRPGTESECPYLAIVVCSKCGWADADEKRVRAAMGLLEVARRTLALAPRRWFIEFPAGEPILTANDRRHRYAANRRTQDLVSLMIRLCRDIHKLPRLEAVTVDLEYANPPFRKAARHPRASDRVEDHDALYPTRKALVDGIVRAGVLVDDNKARVRGGECRIMPETHPMGQLKVTITEVRDGAR